MIRAVAVDYRISWSDPNTRLYDIEIRFIAPGDAPRLILPSWRPGRYLMQHYAVNVREWSANLRKSEISEWIAEARAGDEVSVRYRYWAGVLDAGSSYLDGDEAYFNGSNLFMWVDGLREQPATLTIDAPAHWMIETQLPRVDRHRYKARDYDHLIDSPVVAGAHLIHYTFNEEPLALPSPRPGEERVLHFVSVGLDTERFIEPLRKIARAQTEVFGEFPAREYRFLIHAGDRWHGVEHEESCSMIVKRGAPDFDDHFLSLAAHELFHVWNVKRIMPRVFAPYDYTRETPTRLLWAMEGITSYYGDLSLVRAGVWSIERYLKHLRAEIELLENNAARLNTSLTQTSFDGWLHDPARPHEKGNAWYSFYTKGELVAALLDLTLRRRGRSLDEVMRMLWQERILDEDAVARCSSEPEFFARYVDGIDPLPYDELFAAAGIAFAATPRGVSLGAKLKTSDGMLVIDSLIHDGTAMAAGLLQGDELIAIDSIRVRTAAEVDRCFSGRQAPSLVQIVYARGGTIRRTEVVPCAAGVHVELTIADEENALRAEWLRRIE
jgi:predicted metalloprotease with PDZ domain